jgi:hypothetical protein
MRYVLPPGLTPEEERAVTAALDEYLGKGRRRPDPWSLAGRTEALGLGALQIRHQAEVPLAGAIRSRAASMSRVRLIHADAPHEDLTSLGLSA